MGNGFWAHFLRLSITPLFYCRQESHQKFNCLSIMGRKRKYTLDAVCEPRQGYIWILYMCTMIGIWSYIYRYIDKSIEWNLDFEWKSRAPTQSLSLSLSLCLSVFLSEEFSALAFSRNWAEKETGTNMRIPEYPWKGESRFQIWIHYCSRVTQLNARSGESGESGQEGRVQMKRDC